MIRIIASLLLGFASAGWVTPEASASDRKPNILFIAIDGLRPELDTCGSRAMTPNIDKPAASGVRFVRAYCQQAAKLRAQEMNMYADADGVLPKDHPDAPRKRLIHGYDAATSYADANIIDDPVHVAARRQASEELQQRIVTVRNPNQQAKPSGNDSFHPKPPSFC